MSELPPDRGAGIAELAARRRASNVPPPAPLPVAPPPELEPEDTSSSDRSPETDLPAEGSTPSETVPDRDSSAPKAKGAKRSQRSKRQEADQTTAKLIGQPKGNLRQLAIRVPVTLRRHMDAELETSPDLSLGVIGMDAVRAHHLELRAEVGAPELEANGFAPPRRVVRRSQRGPKTPSPMSVTPAEAEALSKLSDDLGMSVNLIVERCLAMRYHDADT